MQNNPLRITHIIVNLKRNRYKKKFLKKTKTKAPLSLEEQDRLHCISHQKQFSERSKGNSHRAELKRTDQPRILSQQSQSSNVNED